LPRLDRPMELDVLAIDPEAAMRGAKIAGDDLDQRRLAGAVIAHEAHHLALFERQGHLVQRLDRAEVLRNIDQLENRHRRPPAAGTTRLPSRRFPQCASYA